MAYLGKLLRDVRFFRTTAGNEPTRDWLRKMSKEDRAIIGEDLLTVQGQRIWSEPLVKYLGNDLWEVRSTLPRGIARLIFVMSGGGDDYREWIHQEI